MSRGGESLPEAPGAPATEVLRKVRLTDVIELFRDPEEETTSEGYALVHEILEEDDRYYTLVVSFMNDPHAPQRKFTRKYRKWINDEE